MKQMKNIFLTGLLLLSAIGAGAQEAADSIKQSIGEMVPDTLIHEPVSVIDTIPYVLPEPHEVEQEEPDSVRQLREQMMQMYLESLGDSVGKYAPLTEPLLTSKITATARTFGDRIYLRWVPEDNVSWMFLRFGGLNILRDTKQQDEDGDWLPVKTDTLALNLKPLTLDEFTKKFNLDANSPNADEQAQLCAGVIYSDDYMKEGQTQDMPGTPGANLELNSEQDIAFAFAMMTAEWRPDLAQAMAVGFIDNTVKEGATYDYYIQPARWDFGGKILFEPGVITNLTNTSFVPRDYDIEISDTLVSPRRFNMLWIDPHHSAFEIDRREVLDNKANTTTEWVRINTRPYVSMVESEIKGGVLFSDSVDHNGTWEYRVFGHDSFGTLTKSSPVLRVYARDIEPPLPPELKYIVVDRPTDDHMSKVIAHVVWENPKEQYPDIKGYMVNYYREDVTSQQWQPLTPISMVTDLPLDSELISPTDTIASFDVTGMSTGMITLKAYDESGNESTALAQIIRLTDYKAPDAPDSLKCEVLDEGYALLSWQVTNPKDNDIAYFDIATANDSTHTFVPINYGGIKEPMYVDTLELDVNQKYIYYRVRAADYSGNIGEWSPYIRVMRPHRTPPSEPHLDASSHDDVKGMHMRWIVGMDADMTYHLLQRRIGEQGEWEVLARWDADSLAAIKTYAIEYDDNPRFEQEKRIYYRVESHNSTPYTTTSMAVSWMHRGPRFFDIALKLLGDFETQSKEVRLAWETGKLPKEVADIPYYYCVFRKAQGSDRWEYMGDVPQGEHDYNDSTLGKDEEAEYYISIRFKDGRESKPSNTIKIKRP